MMSYQNFYIDQKKVKMIEDPIVYEIYTTFNRDNELPYEDMIRYISDHYEVTETNAKRLYKKAEDLYDELIKSN